MNDRSWCECRKAMVPDEECRGCDDFADTEPQPCPICKGRGTVNPLTAPNDFFCVSTTDCPACDGAGEGIL